MHTSPPGPYLFLILSWHVCVHMRSCTLPHSEANSGTPSTGAQTPTGTPPTGGQTPTGSQRPTGPQRPTGAQRPIIPRQNTPANYPAPKPTSGEQRPTSGGAAASWSELLTTGVVCAYACMNVWFMRITGDIGDKVTAASSITRLVVFSVLYLFLSLFSRDHFFVFCQRAHCRP